MKTQKKLRKVVAIGASAGGVDALVQVLCRLPAELPAAILVVQHLHSDHPTKLAAYLDTCSPLRVVWAQNGMVLEAGSVYVAVPGQHLRLENGRLALDTDKPVHFVRPSADVLFVSAAQAFGSKVIGVVLSGTGRDGARGCQEIKANGGTTIAQDEKTSRYFGMPKAAIDLKAIDHVLPINEIPNKIISFVCQEEAKT